MVRNDFNIFFITIISALVLLTVYFIFKKDYERMDGDLEEDAFSFPVLEDGIKKVFNEIVNQNIAELCLNKKETKKREQQKIRLNKAIRSCAQGNVGEKEFVKDYIKDLLQDKQDKYNVSEDTIDNIIPFHLQQFLTAQDKFEILYVLLSRENKRRAFDVLCRECNLDAEKNNEFGSYYEITSQDIDDAYDKLAAPLRYVECLEIVTQRIYQEIYGFSVADILRDDLTIDGLSGGVSGASSEQYNYMEEVYEANVTVKAKSHHSLWVFYHGKAIHLSFLSFKSQNDLVRTCGNLYRYGAVGQLTSSNGYKLTYQADGSRVVVLRPNLATHWAFFIRKFDSAKNLTLDLLIKQPGSEIVYEFLKWATKGFLNYVLSGDQNSGKTTCLKALGIFFDRREPIRTVELEFEMWLNNAYDFLNCLCVRPSSKVSIDEAIGILKKTDATRIILGEVNTSSLAIHFVSLCQVGSKATMCTLHCVTTEDVVDYLRNSVMSSGTFRDEMIAEEQIVNSLNLDIHWEKTPNGLRYIKYMNEIVPLPREEEREKEAMPSIAQSLRLMSRKRAFKVREIIAYEDGRYVLKNNFSERSTQRIYKNLSMTERKEFEAFCETMKAMTA